MCQLPGNNQPVPANHRPTSRLDASLTIGRQGNITDASVSAVERPLGLAVADNEDAGRGHSGKRDEANDRTRKWAAREERLGCRFRDKTGWPASTAANGVVSAD